jgi:hypothetical protein
VSFFRKLFRIAPPNPERQPEPEISSEVATNPSRRAELLAFIATNGVSVIVKSLGDESTGEPTVFLEYSKGDRTLFPVFSSSTRASSFVSAINVVEVTVYPCLGLDPSFLLTNRFESGVILDPESDCETLLTPGDLQDLRKLLAL